MTPMVTKVTKKFKLNNRREMFKEEIYNVDFTLEVNHLSINQSVTCSSLIFLCSV